MFYAELKDMKDDAIKKILEKAKYDLYNFEKEFLNSEKIYNDNRRKMDSLQKQVEQIEKEYVDRGLNSWED